MSYKVYIPKNNRSKGACWHDEKVEETLPLCDYQIITPHILKYLPQEGRVLEAGCGLGRFLIYFGKRGFNIFGMDISEEGLRRLRSYDPTLKTFVGDVLNIPQRDNSLDAIISLGVIEHFEEGPQKALLEMHRVLKPRGVLCVAVPYQSLMRTFFHWPYQLVVQSVKKAFGKSFVFGEFRFSRREMSSFLRKTSFEILTVEADDFRYPKSLGLFTDWYRYVHHKKNKWELNPFGKIIARCFNAISPWCYPSGIFFVAQAAKERE